MAEMRFSSSLIADPDHFTAEPEIKVYSDPFFCSFFIRIVLLKGQCYEIQTPIFYSWNWFIWVGTWATDKTSCHFGEENQNQKFLKLFLWGRTGSNDTKIKL